MSIAKQLSIYADGFSLASALKEIKPGTEIEALDSTTLNTTGSKSFVTALKDYSLSCEGLWASDTTDEDEIADLLDSVLGSTSPVIVTVSPYGAEAVNGFAWMLRAMETKHEVSTKVGGLIMSSAEFKCKANGDFADGLKRGKFLIVSTPYSSNTNTTGVDNAALSSNGGVLHVHCQSKESGSFTVKLQHSTDNSTWVDLGSTLTFTAKSAQRLVIASGTTVNRYLRLVITTSIAVQVVAAFARL